MSETSSLNLAEIFSNRSYKIPFYQRNYSWSERNIEDLLDDIDFCLEENTKHYLGNIVLNELENSESTRFFDIIDGQQRITTLTLIFSNIYWFSKIQLEPKLEDENSKDQLKKIKSDCKNIFLERRDGDFIEGNLRLNTADQQKEIYQNIILQPPKDRDCDPDKISEQNLRDVSNKIWTWISNKKTESPEETVNYLNNLVNTIMGDISVTEYDTENSTEAGRMFGVLNDRGKDLTTADKVKSTLIYRVSTIQDDPDDLIEYIHEIFSQVYENVVFGSDQSEINNFMSNHWYMFSGPDENSLDNLHRIIEKEPSHLNIEEKTEKEQKIWITNYIESIQEASIAYNKIQTHNSSNNELINSIRYYLNNVASADFMPLQLAIEICLKESEKENVLKNLERISLMSHEIGRRGTQTFARGKTYSFAYKLYSVYNNTTKGRTDSEEIFRTNKGIYSDYTGVGDVLRELDTKSEEIYATKELKKEVRTYLEQSDSVIYNKTDIPGWGGVKIDVLKYVFYRLDGNNNEVYPWTTGEDSIELEHIRPESQKEESEGDLNLVHCLGNLCILERHHNNTCQDDSFDDKVTYYNRSQLEMPKNIVDENTQDWTDDNIKNRQDILTDKIIEMFGQPD